MKTGGGVSQHFNPDGSMVEVGASTCAHCQHITEIPNRRQMMEHVDFCRACMRLICLKCAGKPCTPIMRQIEEAEERFYRSQQFAKSMGFA